MGQRTAIIVQHVNNYKYCDEQGKKYTRVFYHQWGIGRILPSQLMSVINATLSVDTYFGYGDCVAKMKPQGTIDCVADEWFDEKELKTLDKVSFDNPKAVGDILKRTGNNNGGIFVKLTTGEDGSISDIEYAYMLGYEEGGDYKSFCTEEEWMSHFPKYCDKKFKKLYTQMLAYHGAIERANGEEKKDEAAA